MCICHDLIHVESSLILRLFLLFAQNDDDDDEDDDETNSTTATADANSDSDSDDDDEKDSDKKTDGEGVLRKVKLREQPCQWRYQRPKSSKTNHHNHSHSGSSSSDSFGVTQARMFLRIDYRHAADVTHLAWHHKGDYLATASSRAVSTAVVFHILSKPGEVEISFV